MNVRAPDGTSVEDSLLSRGRPRRRHPLVAGKVQTVVEEELTDDTPVKQELMELQMQLELGDIDDDEYVGARPS